MIDKTKFVSDWCQRHAVKIIDSNKRAHRMTKLNAKYFTDPSDYNLVEMQNSIRYETEPLHTVEIANSELEKIAEFESQVFNNMRIQGHYNIFEHLMEQKEREKFLRDTYPAVKKAYEHYSLMLKLAESGDL